eukprot:5595808-Prymnesium_polylepis.1
MTAQALKSAKYNRVPDSSRWMLPSARATRGSSSCLGPPSSVSNCTQYFSLTTTPARTTSTPRGDLNWPGAAPQRPKVHTHAPSKVKACTRWLLRSATKSSPPSRPPASALSPCGQRNSPSRLPCPPKVRANPSDVASYATTLSFPLSLTKSAAPASASPSGMLSVRS